MPRIWVKYSALRSDSHSNVAMTRMGVDMYKKIFLAMMLGTVFCGEAFAGDGSIGATSVGTSTVSLAVPKLIIITGVANASFGTYDPTAAAPDFNDDVSISTNIRAAGRTYQVTATGSGASNALTITDGTQSIPYTVKWNQATGVSGNAAMTAGTALTGRTGANSSLATTTNNANFEVQMTHANIQAVQSAGPGTPYTGTLTLTVAPE